MRFFSDLPEEGEFVVIEIQEIHEHSASANLMGYDESGLLHISEVSRSWVRDISQHLDEGERTVAQVVEVEDDDTVNLSLKRVNDNQKREAMDEWNKEKKADKFLNKVADRTGKDVEELYEEIAFPFQKEYGTTFEGFEYAAMEEVDFDSLGIDGGLAEAITEVANENISLKQVDMEGEMTIEVPGGKGVDAVKDALDVGEKAEISYVSAPQYSITVWGRNAEDAKERMDKTLDSVRESIEESGGTFSFEKK
ncbi:MAG: S1 RNA-binding domain-containing protein [Candidatus Nanohaloarchaeota archaeon QJJ-7]|nr:S1 RNA-binding domain-containing protein [Candidatus Nanohaloarchaeota archaeon QJJ-7]